MLLNIIEYYILIGGIIYTTGSVMQKRWCWLFLISYSPLVIGVSAYKHLYLNSLLYAYYFYSGVSGWIKWGKKANNPILQPSFATTKKQLIIGVIGFFVFILMCFFHPSTFGEVAKKISFFAILLDSLVFVLKISSMYLKTSKNIEGNLLMAVGNGLSTAMFIERGLITSSGLYIYSFIANTIATYTWYKEYENNKNK